MNRRQWLGAAASTWLPVQAGNLPESLHIVTGSAAGGTADALCRRVAAQLAPGYARRAVVENRSGAAGLQAINHVMARPADGRTLLQTSSAALCIAPFIYPQRISDSVSRLTPVTLGGRCDLALATGPAVPQQVRNLQEFMQWAQAHPGRGSFASPALGSAAHLLGVVLAQRSGVDLQHVAYRGLEPALLDLFAGRIAVVCGPLGEMLRYQARGKIRLLASSGTQRSRFAPQLPTLAEQGWTDMAISEWWAFFLPDKAAPDLVERLNEHLRIALAAADVVDRMNALGVQAMSSTPAELAALFESERIQWGSIVQRLGISS